MYLSRRNVEKFLDDHPELVFQKNEIISRMDKLLDGHLIFYTISVRDIFQDRDLANQFIKEVNGNSRHTQLWIDDYQKEMGGK